LSLCLLEIEITCQGLRLGETCQGLRLGETCQSLENLAESEDLVSSKQYGVSSKDNVS